MNSTRALVDRPRLLAGAATSAVAQQDAGDAAARQCAEHSQALRLPKIRSCSAPPMPSVIKATAIVNGDVITQTDVDQRLALSSPSPTAASIPAERDRRLRQQVLRNLIDETLEIQAAKADEDRGQDVRHRSHRRARRRQREADPDQLAGFLEANGSSIKSLRRQIEGEIAWQRLQSAKIESGVSVGDDEVKAVLDKLTASKGTEEYHVGEIFLSATPDTQDADARQCEQDPRAVAERRILRRLRAPIFRSIDGRGRRRPRLGPARTASWTARRDIAQHGRRARSAIRFRYPAAFRSSPCQDTRKILTRDPRDAVLSLKQISITFPKGTTRQVRPSRSSPASAKPRAASAAAAGPTRSPPSSTARSFSRTA